MSLLFSRTDYPTTASWSVAIADLNGDGAPDIVATNGAGGSNSGSVLLNDGDGSFQPQSTFAFTQALDVAVGDLNEDGHPDVVAANGNLSAVSVVLGNGDGTFQPPTTFAVGALTRWVAIGDLNGDGHPDLVVAHQFGDGVSVLLGSGNGSFQAPTPFAAGQFPFSVAIGDLNGDGRPDLAVANGESDTVSVLLGKGDGSFQDQTSFAVGEFPLSVTIGDLNGDGRPDLAVANGESDTVSVLLGKGDGSFQPQTSFAVGEFPHSVAIGDLNGDGKADLVVANESSDTVSVLLGNGDGTFQPQTTFAVGHEPNSVAIGDLNGDGRPDLAVADLNVSSITVLLNTSSNSLPTITSDGGGDTAAISVPENSTAVTTIVASDPDLGQTLSYSIIAGADAGKFKIDANSGVLTFVTAPDFEHPTDGGGNNIYDVSVQVSDGAGGTDTQAIAVTVTDVFENTAPIIISNGGGDTAAISVPENSTAVTTIVASDPDLGQTLSYSIIAGADAGKFKIDANSGVLTFVTAPDFEHPTDGGGNNIYDVSVQVSDGAGGTDTQAIAVKVTDVIEGTAGNDLINIFTSGASDLISGTLIGIRTDQVIIDGGAGDDTIFAAGASGSSLTLDGGDGDDTLVGSSFVSTTLNGGRGNDFLVGGFGNDILAGGPGIDSLFGGGGADKFLFSGATLATLDTGVGANRDVIQDFSGGDVIDLNQIDANVNVAGDQAFSFIGSKAFTAAGQLRFFEDGAGNTIVEGNVDNDLHADFQIELLGFTAQLHANDFVL